MMSPETIVTMGVVATSLTQIVKQFNPPKQYSPLIAMLIAAALTVVWGVSHSFSLSELFDYVSSWVAITTIAMGIHSSATALRPTYDTAVEVIKDLTDGKPQ